MRTELDPLVQRYQNSVQEPFTPELDRLILAAADERAATRRRIRQVGSVALTAALVSLAVLSWQIQRAEPLPSMLSPGTLEGATRDYLLHVEAPSYSGPGLYEIQP
jgi:ferric-dicitrate binding protein FerR (iron transport regulator)